MLLGCIILLQGGPLGLGLADVMRHTACLALYRYHLHSCSGAGGRLLTHCVLHAALGGLWAQVCCWVASSSSRSAASLEHSMHHTGYWALRQHCLPSWTVANEGTVLTLSLLWQGWAA